MGYKPVPFASPLYCWALPGHIFMEWYDGSILDCPTSLQLTIPKQLNDFNSPWAKWALRHEGINIIGNAMGTYLCIREEDEVLTACGSWDCTKLPEFEDAGIDGHVACVICSNDARTIISPCRHEVFMLNTPVKETFPEQSMMIGEMDDAVYPTVLTERGFINFETDGVWVSPPERDWSANLVEMELRDRGGWPTPQ